MQPWVSNEAAAVALGISVRQLQRLRADGLLLPAVHFVRTGPGPRARLRWNVGAVWQALRVQSLNRN